MLGYIQAPFSYLLLPCFLWKIGHILPLRRTYLRTNYYEIEMEANIIRGNNGRIRARNHHTWRLALYRCAATTALPRYTLKTNLSLGNPFYSIKIKIGQVCQTAYFKELFMLRVNDHINCINYTIKFFVIIVSPNAIFFAKIASFVWHDVQIGSPFCSQRD